MKYVLTAIMALCVAGCGTYSKEDIKGDPGASGAPGAQGPAGQDGSNGAQGPQGVAGANGSSFLTGTGSPANTLGNVGDTYLNLSNFNLFVKSSSGWVLKGSIQGSNGTNGVNGTNFLTGSGAPSVSIGFNGSTYLDIITDNLYSNVNGVWNLIGNIQGQAGLGSTPGLSCAVYNLPSYSTSTSLPAAFIGNAIVGTFILPAFNIPVSTATNGFPGMPSAIQNVVGFDGYALDCDGYINISTSGDNYVFQLLSDDGSELRINDSIVISNQGLHAAVSVTSSAIHLDRGLNKINIVYYQGPLTQIALQLSMAGPNQVNAVIPASAYSH